MIQGLHSSPAEGATLIVNADDGPTTTHEDRRYAQTLRDAVVQLLRPVPEGYTRGLPSRRARDRQLCLIGAVAPVTSQGKPRIASPARRSVEGRLSETGKKRLFRTLTESRDMEG